MSVRMRALPTLATAGLLLACLPLLSSLSWPNAKSNTLNTLPPDIQTQTQALACAWMPQYSRCQLRGSIASATPYNCDVQVLTPKGTEVALYKWNILSNHLSAYVRNDALSATSTTLTARQAVRVAMGWMVALHETNHLTDWRVMEKPGMGAGVWHVHLQSRYYNALLWLDAGTGQLRQYQGGLLTGSGAASLFKD